MKTVKYRIKIVTQILCTAILISCEKGDFGDADGRVLVTTGIIDPAETTIGTNITVSVACGDVKLEGKSLPSDFRVVSKGLIYSTDSSALKIKSHSHLGNDHYNSYFGCFQSYSYTPVASNATVINILIRDTLWKDNGLIYGFDCYEIGGFGEFACPLINLQRGTRYYIRSFAHISDSYDNSGTFNKYLYGAVKEFISGGITEDPTVYIAINALQLGVLKQDVGIINSGLDAELICSQINFDHTFGGYNDWRVPTISELQAIYNLQNQIGGFKSAIYWSSTEVYSDDIWYYYLDFSTNTVVNPNLNDYGNKFPNGYVRLVRPLN